LQDSRLRALEIAGRRTAPAQVVLAMASSAPTGTATLAMAYVAAGSDQVIATLRPVKQATIERLSEQLHRTDPGDLILSLARIQRASDDDDVLEFAAFGRASCSPRE
jgi:hypothetical protein